MKANVTLSDRARATAEKRAREEGFESVDAYVDALIEEDRGVSLAAAWLRERIQEGLASVSAGEMTREKIDRLVNEGIARASSKE